MKHLLAWLFHEPHHTVQLDPVTLRHGEEYTARECLSQPGQVHRVDAETVARERLFAARERIAARMGG
jgi:hypothetical protein